MWKIPGFSVEKSCWAAARQQERLEKIKVSSPRSSSDRPRGSDNTKAVEKTRNDREEPYGDGKWQTIAMQTKTAAKNVSMQKKKV